MSRNWYGHLSERQIRALNSPTTTGAEARIGRWTDGKGSVNIAQMVKGLPVVSAPATVDAVLLAPFATPDVR